MYKKILVVVAAGCLFSTAVSAQTKKPSAPVKKPPPPDYFPLRVDDWWKYKSTTADGKESDFTVKVASAEKKDDGTVIYQADTIMSQQIHDWYTKPKGQVLRLREKFGDNDKMDCEYQPPYPFMKNPLEKDASWQWSGKGMMGVDITDNSEVSGPEPVEVPAGKFSAMKVTTKIVQGGSPATKTYWYAGWIGLVKSTTESGSVKSTTELIDYSFKKPPAKNHSS
jgi:hypothetical protein